LVARVLLVCEGKKTEPLYLADLVDELRVPTASFEIVGAGSDPSAVVERAVARAESEDGDYDYIFCVFDRDTHQRYAEACERCRQRAPKRKGATDTKIVAITTNPSFEYWLLLHLKPTTKPYRRAGKKTSGDQAMADFSKEFLASTGKRYEKGLGGVYKILRPKLEGAIKFADTANSDGLDNPHTLVGAMITVMRNIAKGEKADVEAIEDLVRGEEAA
jgi:hypothetical protein